MNLHVAFCSREQPDNWRPYLRPASRCAHDVNRELVDDPSAVADPNPSDGNLTRLGGDLLGLEDDDGGHSTASGADS
jgi:hypothetical protein